MREKSGRKKLSSRRKSKKINPHSIWCLKISRDRNSNNTRMSWGSWLNRSTGRNSRKTFKCFSCYSNSNRVKYSWVCRKKSSPRPHERRVKKPLRRENWWKDLYTSSLCDDVVVIILFSVKCSEGFFKVGSYSSSSRLGMLCCFSAEKTGFFIFLGT